MTAAGVVILTHGEETLYQRALQDVLDQGFEPEGICIVHNPVSPSDRAVDAPPGVVCIRMATNRGYAAGMNTGIRHHMGRGAAWIWLLTHEVRLRDGASRAMCAATESAEGLGALGPVLFDADDGTIFSLGGLRSPFGETYHRGTGSSPHHVDRIGDVEPCAWLDGSTIMLRSSALQAVGLYDESLYIYCEDADLCLRLERAGWRCAVVRAAGAEQRTGKGTRPGAYAYLTSRNGLRYARDLGGWLQVIYAVGRLIPRSVKRILEARHAERRSTELTALLGIWVGVVAFVRGSSGPPPTWLPGLGDMRSRKRRMMLATSDAQRSEERQARR